MDTATTAMKPPLSSPWTEAEGPENEAEGTTDEYIEEAMPQFPLGIEKDIDPSMDPRPDTPTTHSFSRSDTAVSSGSTITLADSCATSYSHQEAQFINNESFIPSLMSGGRRIRTWPDSNHNIRVPPQLREGYSCTNHLVLPMAQGSPDRVECSYFLPRSPSMRPSYLHEQQGPDEQPSSGRHDASPIQRSPAQPLYAKSTESLSSTVSNEAQLSAPFPSTQSSGRPLLGYTTTEFPPQPHQPGALATKTDDKYHGCLAYHPSGHQNNFKFHDALPIESWGSVIMSSTQKAPKWPRKEDQEYKGHGRPDFMVDISNRNKRRQPALATNAVIDSEPLADSSIPSTTEETVPQNAGTEEISGDMGQCNQEGEEGRSPSSPGNPDDTSGSSDEDYTPSDCNDEFSYQNLVENINNVVIESPCVDDLEDGGIPLDLYIHRFLEQVLNHKGANARFHTSCLPVGEPPLQSCNHGGKVSNSRASVGAGHDGNGSSKKRKNGDNSGRGRGGRGMDQNSPDDDGTDDSFEGTPDKVKKRKTGKGENLSCPFRKRNPVRFNVREYEQCALQSFQSLSLLKRHIKHFHTLQPREPFRCPRCTTPFKRQEDLDEHLRVRSNDEICRLIESPNEHNNPENGITEKVQEILSARTNDNKVNSWKGIWRLLFPGAEPPLSDSEQYEPPVELEEVEAKIYNRDILAAFFNKTLVEFNNPPTGGYGFQYSIEIFRKFHDDHKHGESPKRAESEREFLETAEATHRSYYGHISPLLQQPADFLSQDNLQILSCSNPSCPGFLGSYGADGSYHNNGGTLATFRHNTSPNAPPNPFYPNSNGPKVLPKDHSRDRSGEASSGGTDSGYCTQPYAPGHEKDRGINEASGIVYLDPTSYQEPSDLNGMTGGEDQPM